MNAASLSLELSVIQVRTRRVLGVSVIVHLLLFSLMSLIKVILPGQEVITEITWLEPVEIVPRAARSIKRDVAPAAPKPQRLVRETVSPALPDIGALDTKINERLASLQSTIRNSKPIAGIDTPAPVKRPTLAGADPVGSSQPSTLARESSPVARQPARLTRAAPRVQRSTMAVPDMVKTPTTTLKAEKAESTAEKTVAGMRMRGPVADRGLVSFEKPEYPEWAKEEAVEGSVNIYFIVLPDGTVKENVMVQKTSGFADFDLNATEALLAWKFEPLKGGRRSEQWGTITIHYRLN